jgi:uncharacterized membrane protein YagU involved in acid resistance
MLAARDLAIGAVAGLVATRITDRVEVALDGMTPAAAKAREPHIPEGSSAKSTASLLCRMLGFEPSERTLLWVKNTIHYGLGASWGPLYCLARRHGVHPATAGITAGTLLSLLVDDLLNTVLGTTPPAHRFPPSAHLRGLATHVAWGLAAAASAEALYALSRNTPRRAQNSFHLGPVQNRRPR